MRLYFFILIFLVISCATKDSNKFSCESVILKDKTIKLFRVNEIVIKEDNEKFIGEIMHGVVRHGKLFISDRVKNAIVVLNISGFVEKVIGKKGSGPGEMVEISNFDVSDNGLIYLYDMGNKRFSIFDTSGFFHGTFNLNTNLYGATNIKVKEGKIYIDVIEPRFFSASEIYKSSRVAVIDTTGNLIVLFAKSDEIFKKYKLRYFNTMFDFDKFGNIFIAQSGTFRIYKYDNQYNFVKCFGYKGKFKLVDQDIPWNLPPYKTSQLILKYSDTWSIYVRDSLVYYQFVNLTEESIKRRNPFYHRYYLKVYDLDGNYIPSDIELPGRILDVDDEGRIYIYEDNEPGKRRIGVYKLKIKDKS